MRQGIERAEEGGALFLREPLERAMRATLSMQTVERLNDAEIDEAHQSAGVFADVREQTEPLDAFLSLLQGFEWLNLDDENDEAAIQSMLMGAFGDPVDIAMGDPPGRSAMPGTGPNGSAEPERFIRLLRRAEELVARARTLADEERFLNWQVAFPGVWSEWDSYGRNGGFDAVIGNPPWDRMKLQQVEWFAARRPEIARVQRAADRKRMVAALRADADPLYSDFVRANERVNSAFRVSRTGGDYPYLSRGDVNLYSLFVERSMALVSPEGVIGLLTPSGIASDKTAAPFFRSIAARGRLRALYDFENRRTFFPDVHASFKFCVFVAGQQPLPEPAQCAYYLRSLSELTNPERRFPLTADDFSAVNPNTGTAPVFRTRRAAELTTAIYRRLPVLVNRSSGREQKIWPVRYVRMFDMTNDSARFRTRNELEEQEGAWPVGGNRFESAGGTWVPLYEGKMVQAFDHRAASIFVNPENLHRPASPVPSTLEQHLNPDWSPEPRYWVAEGECGWTAQPDWVLGFKEITAPTNARTFIAALLPTVGFGNKVPILRPGLGTGEDQSGRDESAVASGEMCAPSPITDYPLDDDSCTANDGIQEHRRDWLLAANLNATILDFVARQKVHGQTLNLFIVEQLPVVPSEGYESVQFGSKTAAEVVREAVLELTYTAHDMAPFAQDLGYVDETGAVRTPFRWDDERRIRLRAKLDAVYFLLYGVTDRDDIRYVYSTFPIVERQETETYGRYRSRDLCLAYLNALSAGRPDAEPEA